MYEIDMSIKIEDTNRDTVLAIANEKYYTILIPRQVKRKLQELFRKKGKPRLFIYRTFSAGIVLLLKDHINEGSAVVIDKEYSGKERLLRSMIYEMFSRFFDFVPQINFDTIGKHSSAHGVAYQVTKGKQKPDRVAHYREIALLAAPK